MRRFVPVLAAAIAVVWAVDSYAQSRPSIAGPGRPTSAASTRPAYETQDWPAAPLLVWNVKDKRWMEDGKPTGRQPDRNTDVLLPESPTRYMVDLREVRHLTIERNAHVKGGSHAGPMWIWGNTHIKDGGQLLFCNLRGPRHTFFRIDAGEYPSPGGKRTYQFTPGWGKSGDGTNLDLLAGLCRTDITHKFQVCKYEGGSVTFLGKIGVEDEVQVQYGRMIIGPDSEFRYNGAVDKACFEVFDGATLELQSGATLAPFKNECSMGLFNVDVYRGGTLQAGSPEHPLTKDAYVLLGFSGAGIDSGKTGIYCAKGSTVRIYSADPAKARLVFSSITSRADFYDGRGKAVGDPAVKADDGKGIVLNFGGVTDFDGVAFDYVRKEGLRLLEPADRQKWKNVSFGSNCADPSGLLAKMTRNPDYYYHNREYMRYYLVQRSLSAMEKDTGQTVNVTKRETKPQETK
jgi:hypothetical protein